MKLRYLFLSGLAFASASLFAQTHAEGVEYYKADQFGNAKELLLRNLDKPGTDKSVSYYYLGQLAIREKNNAQAEKYFNEGIAADANNPYNYVGLGYLALQNGDKKAAEKYFKEAENKSKKDASVLVEIARSYYDVDPVLYKKEYEKKIADAQKKDIANTDSYILQGDMLIDQAYQTGDSKLYGQAAAKYDLATSYDATSSPAYVKYATMYIDTHNPQYAVQKLEELLANNPTSALGQRELANAYYESGMFRKAAEQYGKYVKNPNHFKEDEDQYAFLLYYDERFQDGYDYSTSLLAENPGNFTAQRFQFMNAAQLDSMKDNLLPMAESLLAAHKSNPENVFAPIDYNLISLELAKDGRLDDGVALVKEGIAKYPDNIGLYKQLSTVYLEGNQLDNAADAYIDYIGKIGDEAGYVDYLTVCLYSYYAGATGDNAAYLDKAEEYANKAMQDRPDMYKPYKVLGDIAIARATDDDAKASAGVPMYEQGVVVLEENNDPRYADDAKKMYKYLGTFYYKKDNAKAKDYFNRLIAIDPNVTNEFLIFVNGL